eukprot:TRINITY_DN18789_c0_g1_i2.p1 TRINITY_DN18789_c0_g1~~TRINITY_DN18789_c0_g1_i2.p1  ORF type:complete len:204 (-),score=49.36 TRINITY_DN18789_c0_g1_i2:183-794(-)
MCIRDRYQRRVHGENKKYLKEMQSLTKTSKLWSTLGKRFISVGQQLPKGQLTVVEKKGNEWVSNTVSSDTIFNGKCVLVGFPGAFTPQCTSKHIPEYIQKSQELKQKGVSKVYALAVNDPFVLQAFAKSLGGDENVSFIADGGAVFTKQLDVGCDLTDKGLGYRARRFSAIVENNKVTQFNDEKSPNMTDLSRVGTILDQLKK